MIQQGRITLLHLEVIGANFEKWRTSKTKRELIKIKIFEQWLLDHAKV
jgi:hypothetical protein